MNPIEAIKLFDLYERLESLTKEKGSFMAKMAQYLHLTLTLLAVTGVPTLAQHWLSASNHGVVFGVLVGISVLLHAICPSIFGGPTDTAQKQAGLTSSAGVLLLFALLFAGSALAQNVNAPPASGAPVSLFTASAEATAFHLNGTWSVANHTTESFDLVDWGKTKANSFAVQGHEILAPTPGYTIALAGFRLTPNIAPLIAKTNIPAGTFSVYVQGAGGVNTGPATHYAFLMGGGVNYRVSSTVTWSSLHVAYLRIGAQNASEVSTGLQYYFK